MNILFIHGVDPFHLKSCCWNYANWAMLNSFRSKREKAANSFGLNQGLTFVKGQAQVSQSMDFLDTAAILANCDLLISSDSAVVHLAGAMGVPTWLGLRWIPEWRWGLEGERTSWYDSVRLFRQESDGDWKPVIQAMIAA